MFARAQSAECAEWLTPTIDGLIWGAPDQVGAGCIMGRRGALTFALAAGGGLPCLRRCGGWPA
jgi:hypothetical protein